MKQTCILILGMHRSGTSALTGTLEKLGVHLGNDLMVQNEYNPKGYFENNRLYKINEKLLAQCNSNWDDVFFMSAKLELLKNSPLLEELKSTLQDEFGNSPLFAIKDPRLAYLFPIYAHILNELDIDIKVVIPYRNPLEVADSLHKRDHMSPERAMLLWAYHVLLSEKNTRKYKRFFFSFDTLIKNSSELIQQLSSALKLDLLDAYKSNQIEIDEFLEQGLKHHNLNINDISEQTPKIVKDIIELRHEFNTKNIAENFDSLYSNLISMHKLFYHDEITAQHQTQKETKHNLYVTQQELQTTQAKLNDSENALHVTQQELETSQNKCTHSDHIVFVTAQEIFTLQKKFQKLEEAFLMKKNTIKDYKKIIKSKEHDIHALQSELISIYLGQSWKLTRPLRRLKKIFLK